jgi:hypothetical protein
MNIIPMHLGQATVCSRAWQYWHCGELEETGAPQAGQLSVRESMDDEHILLRMALRN